jgi:hypothetical protein
MFLADSGQSRQAEIGQQQTFATGADSKPSPVNSELGHGGSNEGRNASYLFERDENSGRV